MAHATRRLLSYHSVNSPLNYTDPSGHAPVETECDAACQERKAAYYEEESRQNYRRAIQQQQNALAQFGVTVEFGVAMSLGEQYMALSTVRNSVEQIGNAFASQGYDTDGDDEIDFWFSSDVQAFRTVFGSSSTITITNNLSSCGNIGTKPACNTGSFSDEGSQIYITPEAILGNATFANDTFPNPGSKVNPEQLLVHEFAHYFTNPLSNPFNGNPSLNVYGFTEPGAAEAIQWTVHNSDALNFGRSGLAAEVTADVITNWVYGRNFGGPQNRNSINLFMNNIFCASANAC